MDKKDLFEELKTERLNLRKISINDAEKLYESIYSKPDYYKFYWQRPFDSFEHYKSLIKMYEQYYLSGNYFKWGIALKDTNEIIGIVQLHGNDSLNNNCKIGYIINSDYMKLGYASEAVKEVINFSLNKLNYHRIEALIVEENKDSIKLAERVGMKFESTRKEGYKVDNKYYDQKVYTVIKNI